MSIGECGVISSCKIQDFRITEEMTIRLISPIGVFLTSIDDVNIFIITKNEIQNLIIIFINIYCIYLKFEYLIYSQKK